MSTPRVNLILQQLETLPTLPAVAVRVLEAVSGDDARVGDVCRLIESDPALAARILQLVNRADVGGGEVASLERAVALLGFDSVRCAVLAVSVMGIFGPGEPAAKFDRDAFWKHSIAVGCCCEMLATRLKGRGEKIDPAEAFVAGLLHDIGKLALDTAVPKSYLRVVETADMLRGNIADVERSVIGIDHNVVGKRLAERWQLPPALREAIWLHGQLPAALPPSVRHGKLVNLVTLADLLVREQHLGYSGNYTFPVSRQCLLDALRLSQIQPDAIVEKLIVAVEGRAKLLGLGSAEAQELYRQALQQANRELSRVSDQLAARNRKLSVRSKYFEALAAFQNELRPDAPPADVLAAIGQTAAAVLETPAVAVFSLPPGAMAADVAVLDRSGTILQTLSVDRAGGDDAPPRPRASSAVQPTGPELEWLVQSCSPMLAGAARFWLCLVADHACVGGVLFGGPADEPQRLAQQQQELAAVACGWSLALRTCQIRDESRLLSEQLAEANRQLQTASAAVERGRMLTTVAEMAAGAAHEMNNPLAVISGRSQLLAASLPEPKDRAAAKLIYEKSQTLSDMITEMMHFAKPQPPQPRATGLLEIVDRAVALAKSRCEIADRHIDLRVGDTPAAMVDGAQMTGAIAEIVQNALAATKETGRVTITASFDSLGRRLVVSITDDGCGMDEHTLAHACDPFFSAQRAGRRPGMGLAKALRWIESAGGSLRLESKPNRGTRAIVVLPAAEEEATPTAVQRAAT
ncbi:MAG TPA: HDOD domain-containing protein [Tepidisphaeraceae bacterium]|jgi:putative nucleotidyltransferase with HDIG domain